MVLLHIGPSKLNVVQDSDVVLDAKIVHKVGDLEECGEFPGFLLEAPWKPVDGGQLHDLHQLLHALPAPAFCKVAVIGLWQLEIDAAGTWTGLVLGEVLIEPNLDASDLVEADHVIAGLQWSEEGAEGVVPRCRAGEHVQSLFEGEGVGVGFEPADDVLDEDEGSGGNGAQEGLVVGDDGFGGDKEAAMHFAEGIFFELDVVLRGCVRDGVGLEPLVRLLVGPQLAIALVLHFDPILPPLGSKGEAVLVGWLVAHLRIYL